MSSGRPRRHQEDRRRAPAAGRRKDVTIMVDLSTTNHRGRTRRGRTDRARTDRARTDRARRRLATGLAAVLLAGAAGAGATPAGAAPAEAPPPGTRAPEAGAADVADAGAAVEQGRRTYTGTIDGADYRVEMPATWNGTLVLYSHGYWPTSFPAPPTIALSNSPETETWLLDHGYALAASNFQGVQGFQVARGQQDQIALLDWFGENVGQPERTISTGQSMGGSIAVNLAEHHPERFDGVVTVCAGYDPQNTWNAGLDVAYAVRTLLLPDREVDLVRPVDAARAEADTAALSAAVTTALATEEGRARLALVASMANISGWWSALAPRPTDPDEVIRQQANWILYAYIGGFAGPTARLDLEHKVGGNPSSNEGVDYRRQLLRSAQTRQVIDAYRAAGLDLGADLDALNGGPRVAADPEAVRFMEDTSVPSGELTVPMVSLHSVGDGGAPPDQERWYAGQVRRHGGHDLLRQLYVDRGQHCSTSAADEVVALQTLLRRIDDRRWPSTSPHRLNAAVAGFAPEYQVVTDFSTGVDRAPMPPAFVRYQPPPTMRPTH
jgi:pimeloyl-ACP methyl ester carboxylesterase